MQYHIITYGCQMNYSDSEKIAATLKKQKHKPAKNEEAADLIVINSCSVRQAAIHRVYEKINRHSKKKIIIAGCVLKKDKKQFIEKGASIWNPTDYFDAQPMRQNKYRAFVPIMTGCNNFCSYCAVPFTRGREKSRPACEILKEIKSLTSSGYKKIILLGQNVNSYKSGKTNFPALLKKINALSKNFWLSFMSSHPKDMSNNLIKTIVQCEKITPYIHLAAQSGNNEILKKMNRHYSAEHFSKLVKKIRSEFQKYRPAFPPVAVSTDFIIGFPGETKKQFSDTAKLMRQLKFDMAYLAQYSPRPGTAATEMKDDIPKNEKKCRFDILNEILKKTALANNKKYIGKNIKILIEKSENGFAFGKTITGKNVKIESQNLNPGDLIKAKITSATAWSLKGELA